MKGSVPDHLNHVSSQIVMLYATLTRVCLVAILFGYFPIIKRICVDDTAYHIIILRILHLCTSINSAVICQRDLAF